MNVNRDIINYFIFKTKQSSLLARRWIVWIPLLSVIPVTDPRARALYHYMASGVTQDPAFYRDLNQVDVPPGIQEYIDSHRADDHQDHEVFEGNSAIEDDQDNEYEDMEESDENEEAEDSDSDSDDEDLLWQQYQEYYKIFESKLKANLQNKDFKKCFKKYTKNVLQVASSRSENLKQHLYGFGQTLGRSKKGSRIPVQTTAVARRKHPHGGRGVAMAGRRVQDVPHRVRMDVGEDSETILQTLPKQKPQPKRQPHSLQNAISQNSQNAKKH